MSRIQRSVELLAETLQKKNGDYAGSRGEFFNFERSGEIADCSAMVVMLSQIGIKVTRIQNLFNSPATSNEPLQDSFLDLAGYAIIAHAYLASRDEVEEDFMEERRW